MLYEFVSIGSHIAIETHVCYNSNCGFRMRVMYAPVEIALYKCSTCIVDRFDQAGVSDTDGVGSKTNIVAVLFVQLSLCFDVCLAIVVEEAPDVGEFGEEGTGEFLEWGLEVGHDVLSDENSGPEGNCLDQESPKSHRSTPMAVVS
jgi:hypothetical protein